MMKNKIKSIRHQLQIDTQKEFAKLIHLKPSQYSYVSKWESQKEQPLLENVCKIQYYVKQKHNITLALEDIIDYTPE